MVDYEKMYYQLFNVVTDVVNILQKAHRQGEETFLDGKETELTLLQKKDINNRKATE